MSRLVFLSVLGIVFASGTSVVHASSCAGIANDGDRLSCFDSARDCAGITAAETRLACFDERYGSSEGAIAVPEKAITAETAVVGNTASKHNISESVVTRSVEVEESVDSKKVANESVVQSPAPVQGDTEDKFGRKKEFSDPTNYIEAKIVEVKRNSQKIDYIRLDNGHVWREYQDYRVRYKVGQSVVIEEGVLGSFNMKIDGVTKLIKMKRVD